MTAISIHALLAESDLRRNGDYNYRSISIHALLAESDQVKQTCRAKISISIHALLAESDAETAKTSNADTKFLSTLSLRRATARRASRQQPAGISIHALLAESDGAPLTSHVLLVISIHALLAESDLVAPVLAVGRAGYFYPRSPCGERRRALRQLQPALRYFYPRSPCGERPLAGPSGPAFLYNFYPRSPCGERR